jgi:hypothetical protein
MTKYKTITLWEPAIAEKEFHDRVDHQIKLLTAQGKTDGTTVVTRPKPYQRLVERIWIDLESAQAWTDWLDTTLWPKAKESKILACE